MNVNMVAPYEGVLKWVGTPSGGISKTTGEPWKMVDFVITYLDHQMQERDLVFSLSGVEKVTRLLALAPNTKVRVSWVPSAREWTNQQGETKWFPQYTVLNFTVIEDRQAAPQAVGPAPQQQQPPQPAPAQTAPQQGAVDDDLPF